MRTNYVRPTTFKLFALFENGDVHRPSCWWLMDRKRRIGAETVTNKLACLPLSLSLPFSLFCFFKHLKNWLFQHSDPEEWMWKFLSPPHRRREIQGAGSFVYSWGKMVNPVTCSNFHLVIRINNFFKVHFQILNLELFQLHIREPSAEKNHPPFQNNLAENLHREASKILP